MTKIREKKQLSFFMAVLPIFAMILFLGVGYITYGLRAEPMILLSAGVAAIIAYFHGYNWDEILAGYCRQALQSHGRYLNFNLRRPVNWCLDDWWYHPNDGLLRP